MSKHMEAAATTQPELFFWERPELDFPLYDDETMGLWQPILLIGSAVAALVSLSFLPDSRMVKSAALFLGPLVPYLIVARGNIFTIIKRPRLGDIILVPVTLILTIAYSLGMGILLYKLGFEIQGNGCITRPEMRCSSPPFLFSSLARKWSSSTSSSAC